MIQNNTRLRKFVSDNHGRVVIGQVPNAPLVVWLVASVASHLLKHGHAHTLAHGISFVAIVFWATWEVTAGASYFRRTLGLLVLLVSIISFW